MKFFRIDLLTLLISLFILSGCKNQTGIGLDPENKLNGNLYVDTNIVVNTALEDSVITTGIAKTALGYINDPEIGPTEASTAFSLGLPGNAAYTLPTGTVYVDSAVLVLRYAEGFYGDSLTTKYKANVYQLTERPLASRAYYSTKTWTFNAPLLGTATVNSRTHTSFKITDIVKGAKDTLKTVPAQMRIRLDTTFMKNNFFNAGGVALGSNTAFQNLFKGLYVNLDKAQINGTGGSFMLALDSSRVDVYYRANNNGTIDTAVASLPVGAHAGSIKHTYNANVTAALNNTTTSSNTFYIQGLAGLRAKVSFPKLKDILTQAGSSIVLNRAELVITPAPGTTIPLQAQRRISMYQLDIAKQRIPLQDANVNIDSRALSASVFGGYFTTNNDYHFVITGYIEDLLRGKTVDYGTYLGAVDFTNVSTTNAIPYAATAQTAGRLVAVGTPGKTAANYPYRIKLNIIYTKVSTVK